MHNSEFETLEMEDLRISNSVSSNNKDKAHPWRICPIGKHYVKTHDLHIPPSKKYPNGHVVTRHGHCADNPSHKDVLSYDELQIISKNYFSSLTDIPKMGFFKKPPQSDKYDSYIQGWVRYWNEIYRPTEPLDPNLVKALIASESSFRVQLDTPQDTKEKNRLIGHALGLMQITESTLRALKTDKNEIRNNFIHLTREQIMDPSANICVGVRWLFTKKTIARERLGHASTWDDAVAEYKGKLKDNIENKDPSHDPDPHRQMAIFRSFYNELLESMK